MSVAVQPWKRGGFQVTIRFRWPDRTVYRDRRVVDLPTLAQARKWGEQREREVLAAGQPKPEQAKPKKTVPTFKAFVERDWWPVYPKSAGNSHTTVREKTTHLKVHLVPFFGGMPLDKIDKHSIDRFVAEMAAKTKDKDGKKTISTKRIKNVVATLRKVLVTAHEWGKLDALPKFPKLKISAQDFDFFVRDESDTAINAARDPEERAILMFAFHTGARAGEQIAFEWGDLDLHNKFVSFRRSSTDGVVKDSPKSAKPRKVPLTASLEAALKAIRHAKGPLVFCNPDGSPMSLWQLHERLWGACRRAKLRKIRWHDCRHSFASQLVIAGAPLRQVQEWLGHSSITMTMRYSHLAPGGGREFMAALEVPALMNVGRPT